MQWNSLQSYFLSDLDLDDDPTESNPDEKPSTENRLVNAYKRPVRKLYVMFLQSVIPIFDSFNTFLPAEEPLIYILYHSTFVLLITFKIYPTSIYLRILDVLKDFNAYLLEQ